jgi:shikimate dehydrogenase
MFENFSGATRVHIIVGDPIAQVKSPFGVTQAFEQLGKDAVCIPAQVPTKDLKQWFEGVSLASNIDSIIVTVPHTPVGMYEQKDATPRRVQTCSCKSANSWCSSC